jgi:hypothetical protein
MRWRWCRSTVAGEDLAGLEWFAFVFTNVADDAAGL